MLDADQEASLRRKMADHGVEYDGPIVADGGRHRFHIKGDKSGAKNGFYQVFTDGVVSASFGDWKQHQPGEFPSWSSKSANEMTQEEKAAHRRHMEKAAKLREAERQKRENRASKKAREEWEAGRPAEVHPYLDQKKISGTGAKIDAAGRLIIPIKDVRGEIRSLQRISDDGCKRFLPDGAISKHFATIGSNKKGVAYVVEGFATGATIHAATGQPVIVAFNAGNLEPVIAEIRRKSPKREIAIVGDDDRFTEANPGRTKAEAAARKHNCKTIFPKFKTIEGKPTDFNDLAVREGIEEVRRQLKSTAPEQRKGFRLVPLANIEPKAPEYILDKLLERDNLAVVFGDPATAKSFVAVDMACCVGSETPFHGHPVLSGPVVYIAGEGQSGIARRFMAWGICHGIDYRVLPVFVSMVPASMCDEEGAMLVLDAIKNMDPKPVLIIFDTLARNFGPGDENSTPDMSRFIGNADRIRAICGAAVLIIHHSGHGDKTRARGAMALKAGVDAEYHLTRDDAGVITMKNLKMKDAPPPNPISFRIRSVELPLTREDGKPVTSAVLDDLAGVSEPVAFTLLALLRRYAAAGQFFSKLDMWKNPAGKGLREDLKANHRGLVFKVDVPQAIDLLIQRGQLRPEQTTVDRSSKTVFVPTNNDGSGTAENDGINKNSLDIYHNSNDITMESKNDGIQDSSSAKTKKNSDLTMEDASPLQGGERDSGVPSPQEGEGRKRGKIE